MLEVEGLHTFYGHIHALRNVTLSVDAGNMVCVIGANGAGKSTLLKTLVGLIKPQSGTVRFLGRDVTSCPTHEIVRLGMGLVPERRQLFGPLSVLDNLRLGAFCWVRDAKPSEWFDQLERVYQLFSGSQRPARTEGGDPKWRATADACDRKGFDVEGKASFTR
jgi:branched-chain amino acid transport system ATP-binding protein